MVPDEQMLSGGTWVPGKAPPGSVWSEDTEVDLFVAVSHTADRVARAVARILDRERT